VAHSHGRTLTHFARRVVLRISGQFFAPPRVRPEVISPSFLFPLYLSLSSGTDREKGERGKRKRKNKEERGRDITSCYTPPPPRLIFRLPFSRSSRQPSPFIRVSQ
jgi:hypothetical protein